MLTDRWSLKTLVISSIIVMGLVAVISAPLAGHYYQHFALDSQGQALEQIITIQSRNIVDELHQQSIELGRAIQSNQEFRAALEDRDLQRMRDMLEIQHHQYFVTTGVLKLHDLVIYSLDMELLVHSPVNKAVGMSALGHCPQQLTDASRRQGAQRLQPMQSLCLDDEGLLHAAVLVPLGGLQANAYLQIITDPTWNLRQLSQALGLPLRIHDRKHAVTWTSDDWPEQERDGVIAQAMVTTDWDQPGMYLEIYSDTTELAHLIESTSQTILAISLAVVFVLTGMIIMLLNKSTFGPLERLRSTLKILSTDKSAIGTTLTVRGQKEIRGLTLGFNEMSRALQQSYNRLQEHQQVLEDEVARRTSDLQLAKDEAQQANRAKSQFLANMSHELRTPLNAVIGYSEMIIDEVGDAPLGPEARQQVCDDLDKILNAGRHLLTLINDVLDLSKIEAGKMELYLEDIDVRTLVTGLTDTIMPMANKNQNEITVSCPDDIGSIHTDITKLRQALFNILSNACKFTRNGRINIDIVKYDELGTEYISFAVSDDGIGIPQEKLVHLFKAFSQADNSTTRRFGGTGLGLVLSKHFCRMMGGDIAVTSQPDKGSRFTVFVPVAVQELRPANKTESDIDLGKADPIKVRLGRYGNPDKNERRRYISQVLVIDDDAAIRDLLTRFLNKEGFQVHSATGGEEGLAMARELIPDVITLDIMMPEMDGWAVLSHIKRDPALAAIPVIMLSMIEDRQMGFSLGAADYLSKPLQRDTLLDSIRRIIRSKPEQPILIVEDEDDIRDMVRRTLVREGWKTMCAANGREALEQLELQLPGLILLDLMMPEMDGFEFINRLREQPAWRNIPVVVLTAMDLSPEEQRFLQAGTEHIMHKGSFDKADLLSQVHSSIRTFLRRELRGLQDPEDN